MEDLLRELGILEQGGLEGGNTEPDGTVLASSPMSWARPMCEIHDS